MVTQVTAGNTRLMLVPHNIREEEPPCHREDDVEAREDAERVARQREPAGQHRSCRRHRADQERDEERQQTSGSITSRPRTRTEMAAKSVASAAKHRLASASTTKSRGRTGV